MDPGALARQGYHYWIQLLRRSFEHAGALRIDHVMGLFRSFWIPDGGQGEDGAYVGFPARELLGILCLESVRHDALVVGEDLGTVPREVPPALRKRGILSSKVLYFERSARGFKPASAYPPLALATANTHDLPTLGAFWTGSDIALRASAGLLPDARAVRAARRAREADRKALLRRLRLARPATYEEERFPRRLARSVHDFLCSTRSALVGISLDDLIGETQPVNLPGVGPERYQSWRRRSRMTLEEAGWSFEIDETIGCRSRRGAGR
jgi:4-alpha-glucanotransferase